MKLASWLCAIFIEIVFLVYKLAGEIGDLGLEWFRLTFLINEVYLLSLVFQILPSWQFLKLKCVAESRQYQMKIKYSGPHLYQYNEDDF